MDGHAGQACPAGTLRGHRRRDGYARASGEAVVQLLRRGITARDILTKEAFENAIAVVMAFEADTWRRLRQLRPDTRTGALYSARMLPAARVESELQALHQAGVSFVGLHQAIVGPDVPKQTRLAGLTRP